MKGLEIVIDELQGGKSDMWRPGFCNHLLKAIRAMKKNPGLRDLFGDDILPSYVGIVINHSKDPYESTSITTM